MQRLYLMFVLAGLMAMNLHCAGESPRVPTGSPKAAAVAPPKDDQPIAPKDAQWTLRCKSFTDMNHVDSARRARSELLAITKMKDWYVIHAKDSSTLYYGYYKTIDRMVNLDEAQRVKQDREAIIALTDSTGRRVFGQTFAVRLDSNDPEAPVEWNLVNATGDYTLVVEAFKDNPERKHAAVVRVKELRDKGYEAYYFHDENSSSVCIGSYPASSIKLENVGEIRAQNPNEDLVVANDPMVVKDRDKARAKVPTMTVLDPKLKAMQSEFPQLFVNYEARGTQMYNKQTKQFEIVAYKSYVAAIPRNAGASAAP